MSSGNETNNNNNDDHPGGSDKALLDRLNALKPTNVTLDSSSSSAGGTGITPADTISRAKPPSREDALSDRLKSLRNQIGGGERGGGGGGGGSDRPSPSPRTTSSPQATSRQTKTELDPTQTTTAAKSSSPGVPSAGTALGEKQGGQDADTVADADDPLLLLSNVTDDQTLEELLADLESDQQWVEEVAADEEDEQHRRAMALLEELKPGGGGGKAEGAGGTDKDGHEDGDDDDDDDDDEDDSEGEVMTREADDVIAKAMDEIALGKGDDIVVKKQSPADTEQQPTDEGDNENDDFAASIASRMAALKVSPPPPSPPPSSTAAGTAPALPSVPSSEPDPFAAMLPSAPTFSPAIKPPVSGRIVTTSRGRSGFTDEDQKSWCTVCLEDGAIRCLGCCSDDEDDGPGAAGDIYCARCWKEMHIGPRASFEERGHQWEKYTRPR